MLLNEQRFLGGYSSNQQWTFALNQFTTNRHDLISCLRLSEHDFRHALPQCPVMIDSREAEIDKGHAFQVMQGLLRTNIATLNLP